MDPDEVMVGLLRTKPEHAEAAHDYGRTVEALALIEAALATVEAKWGEGHWRSLHAMNFRAECLQSLERTPEAFAVNSRVLALAEVRWGIDDIFALGSFLNMQASLLGKMKRFEEALAVSERIVQAVGQLENQHSRNGGRVLHNHPG